MKRLFLDQFLCGSVNLAVPDPLAMDPEKLVTPVTAPIVDTQGRFTYMGADGSRRVIVGDADLLRRIREIRSCDGQWSEYEGGCGI